MIEDRAQLDAWAKVHELLGQQEERIRSLYREKAVPLMVGKAEAAALVGISESLWQNLVRTAQVPRPIRLASRVLWSVEELRAWVAAGCPPRDRWEAKRNAAV